MTKIFKNLTQIIIFSVGFLEIFVHYFKVHIDIIGRFLKIFV